MRGEHPAPQGASLNSRVGIAAQALAAVALAVVVYFAFIEGDGSGPLSGIEVDDGKRAQAPSPGQTEPKGRRPRPEPRRTFIGGSPAPSFPSTPPAGFSPDTPAGSQYQSPVARILDRVSPGGP